MNPMRDFLRLETLAGIALVAAAALAFILVNGGGAPLYERILGLPVEVRVGGYGLAKPLLLWINDGLMAVFFLLVGLEIKREALEGELSSRAQAVIPLAAAAGGMAVPAAIYAVINREGAVALNGWAIPSATDIAFTLAVLSLLGRRVPPALTVFLTAVAIIDDIGAIAIIAVFYTEELSFTSLTLAGAGLIGLLLLNLSGVTRKAPYILIGVFVWLCVLKSGVHATLAGVALAMAIPMRGASGGAASPLRDIEHALHPWVAFLIVPLFGFANAGVDFSGLTPTDLASPIPLGVALGLFLGKQVGVLLGAWLAVVTGIGRLPQGLTWSVVHGGAVLCGIGFTMSLFIGTLAFEHAPPPAGGLTYAAATRLGVLMGSIVSALIGALLVVRACRALPPPTEEPA